MKADEPILVVDFDSIYIKFGLGGETYPRYTIPGHLQINTCSATMEQELLDLFKKIIKLLIILDEKECRVMMIESVLLHVKIKQALNNVLFKHFNFSSIIWIPRSVCAAIAFGKESGALHINIGHLYTSIVPIYELLPLNHHHVVVERGMRDVTLAFQSHLPKDFPQRDLDNVVAQYATLMPLSETSVNFLTTLGDLVEISSHSQRDCVESVFFSPNTSEHLSIQQAILDSLLQENVDVRRGLASSIIVCSEQVLIPGFRSILQTKIIQQLNEDEKYAELRGMAGDIRIIVPEYPPHLSEWVGASLLASLSSLSFIQEVKRESHSDFINDWSFPQFER